MGASRLEVAKAAGGLSTGAALATTAGEGLEAGLLSAAALATLAAERAAVLATEAASTGKKESKVSPHIALLMMIKKCYLRLSTALSAHGERATLAAHAALAALAEAAGTES